MNRRRMHNAAWRCTLCDTEMQISSKGQHLIGRRHMDKLERTIDSLQNTASAHSDRRGSGSQGAHSSNQGRRADLDRNSIHNSGWHCGLCDVDMQISSKIAHLIGRRHAELLDEVVSSLKDSSIVEPPVEEVVPRDGVDGYGEEISVHGADIRNGVETSAMNEGILIDFDDIGDVDNCSPEPPEPVYSMTWTCDICEETMNIFSREDHLIGKDHDKKIRKQLEQVSGGTAEPITPSQWLWECTICDTTMNVFYKNEHLAGSEHNIKRVANEEEHLSSHDCPQRGDSANSSREHNDAEVQHPNHDLKNSSTPELEHSGLEYNANSIDLELRSRDLGLTNDYPNNLEITAAGGADSSSIKRGLRGAKDVKNRSPIAITDDGWVHVKIDKACETCQSWLEHLQGGHAGSDDAKAEATSGADPYLTQHLEPCTSSYNSNHPKPMKTKSENRLLYSSNTKPVATREIERKEFMDLLGDPIHFSTDDYPPMPTQPSNSDSFSTRRSGSPTGSFLTVFESQQLEPALFTSVGHTPSEYDSAHEELSKSQQLDSIETTESAIEETETAVDAELEIQHSDFTIEDVEALAKDAEIPVEYTESQVGLEDRSVESTVETVEAIKPLINASVHAAEAEAPETFRCQVCGDKEFPMDSYRYHTGRGWECIICDKVMHRGSRESHIAGSKHRIQAERKRTASYDTVLGELATMASVNAVTVIQAENTVEADTEPFYCELCDKEVGGKLKKIHKSRAWECTVCDITLHIAWKYGHINGGRHMKKQALQQELEENGITEEQFH